MLYVRPIYQVKNSTCGILFIKFQHKRNSHVKILNYKSCNNLRYLIYKEFNKIGYFVMSKVSRYPSVVERYFKKFFFKDKSEGDICILAHSNRICLVTLSPNHKALSEGPIKYVSFNINGKDLATQNKVHGKKKLQAIQTHPMKVICEVVSATGTVYHIRSAIYGKLIEVNKRLLEDSTLLDKKFGTDGYIGIILHKHCTDEDICKNLLTESQYEELTEDENIPSKKRKTEEEVEIQKDKNGNGVK